MTIFLTIFLSCACAVLYRMGGAAGYSKAWRRFGCPVVLLGIAWFCGLTAPWWAYLLAYGAMYGSLTTYFEFDGNGDTDWPEWILTGLFTGLAAFPLVIHSEAWLPLIYRTASLTVGTLIWSESQDNDVIEELGRGFLLGITIPLLML